MLIHSRRIFISFFTSKNSVSYIWIWVDESDKIIVLFVYNWDCDQISILNSSNISVECFKTYLFISAFIYVYIDSYVVANLSFLLTKTKK